MVEIVLGSIFVIGGIIWLAVAAKSVIHNDFILPFYYFIAVFLATAPMIKAGFQLVSGG